MNQERQKNSGSEDNDRNKQEPHDPVKAGREAIEAGKIADGSKGNTNEEAEKKDADTWRNEG